MDTLRGYRDQILSQSTAGQQFVQLWENYGLHASRAILKDLSIVPKANTVFNLWTPALEALLANNGDSYIIDVSMALHLDILLGALEVAAPGPLPAILRQAKQQIGTDTLVGISMDELQSRVEGTSVDRESESWGALKSRWKN